MKNPIHINLYVLVILKLCYQRDRDRQRFWGDTFLRQSNETTVLAS